LDTETVLAPLKQSDWSYWNLIGMERPRSVASLFMKPSIPISWLRHVTPADEKEEALRIRNTAREGDDWWFAPKPTPGASGGGGGGEEKKRESPPKPALSATGGGGGGGGSGGGGGGGGRD